MNIDILPEWQQQEECCRAQRSPWDNPYVLGEAPSHLDRELCILRYGAYLLRTPALLERVGKRIDHKKEDGCHTQLLNELLGATSPRRSLYQAIDRRVRALTDGTRLRTRPHSVELRITGELGDVDTIAQAILMHPIPWHRLAFEADAGEGLASKASLHNVPTRPVAGALDAEELDATEAFVGLWGDALEQTSKIAREDEDWLLWMHRVGQRWALLGVRFSTLADLVPDFLVGNTP